MGSYGGQDLGGLLQFLGSILLVLAGAAGAVLLVAWWRRRRGKSNETLAIDVTLTLCGGLVLLFLIAIPFGVIQTMTSPSVTITDFPFQTALFQDEFQCTGASTVEGGAHIECLSVSSGSATVSELSSGIRMLLASAQVLWSLLTVLPAVALGIICFQLLRGVPFARTVTRTLLISAGAVFVLGMAAPAMDGISKGAASAAALPPDDGSAAALAAGGFSVSVPIWPVGAALALLALAAVFRYGAKLQRDTELLV